MQNSKKFRSDKRTYLLFSLVPVVLYAVFYVFSMLSGFYYSLTDWNGIDATYQMIGLKNYQMLFANTTFWRSLSVTMQYALLLVVITAVLSLVLAISLNSLKAFRNFAKSVFFVPAMIGSVTIALIWNQLFYRAVPLVGQALGIKFLSQSPLANPRDALYAVVFVNIWQSVAMPTIIFIAGLQSIPLDLYESAQIDGATIFKRFRYITLPYLAPTITINVVLLLKQGMTTFDFPYALTGGGPARSTMVLAIQIMNDAFTDWRFATANAEAVVLFLFISIFSFVQIKATNKHEVSEP